MSNSVIDSIQNDEREKPIIQSLFECFKHAGAVGLLHFSFIFIFHYLNPTETGVSRRKEQAQPDSHRERMSMHPSHLSTKAGVQKIGSGHLQPPPSQSRSGGAHLKPQVVKQADPCESRPTWSTWSSRPPGLRSKTLPQNNNKQNLSQKTKQTTLNAFSLKSHQKV